MNKIKVVARLVRNFSVSAKLDFTLPSEKGLKPILFTLGGRLIRVTGDSYLSLGVTATTESTDKEASIIR